MTMQNLVLAVQNTVPVAIIGTASSTVAFFRSVFGAIGVLVLGTILNNRSTDLITQGLATKGIKLPAGSTGGASLDFNDMPAPIADVVRSAFGDASAESFLVAGIIGIVAILAVLFIKEVPLRRTVDIAKPSERAAQSMVDVGSEPAAVPAPAVVDDGIQGADDDGDLAEPAGSPSSDSRQFTPARRAAVRAVLAGSSEDPQLEEGSQMDSELQLLLADADARLSEAAAPQTTAETLAALQETQRLLAVQQAKLATLMSRISDQLAAQQDLAAQQRATAERQDNAAGTLAEIQRELDAERQLQKEAALYIATRGRHSAS
jgi:hypothetical protein